MGIFSLKSLRKKRREIDEVKSFNKDQMVVGPGDRREIGIREVPLEKIVGSVGRYHDFDHRFRLKRNIPSERLQAIKTALREGKSLPPVALYKIEEEYYVVDGNHRVAAANEMGWKTIAARIIEFLPSQKTLANILAREKSDFEWQTGLFDLIVLTEVGQYAYLLAQIQEHKEALEELSKKSVSLKNAARDWYNTIYKPFIRIIERSHLPKAFRERTLSDLYAYIACHQWTERRDRKYGVGIDQLIPNSMEKFRAQMAKQEHLHPPEMTRETTAFVLINVAAKKEGRVMDRLYAFNEVKEIHAVPGEFDILAKVAVDRDLLSSDSEVIGEFLDLVRAIPGVLKTQTIIPIVSKYKKKFNP